MSDYWDQYQFEDTASFIDPEVQQSILEQPIDIVTYEDEDGDIVTFEADPTTASGIVKQWDPDDVLIAVDRANSEVAPQPFHDPVDQDIIAGTSGS